MPPPLCPRRIHSSFDSAQAARGVTRRGLTHKDPQPREDFLFRIRVNRRQRVVQHEDLGVDGDRARERRPLFLSARQRDTSFANHRVVALREVRDVLVETGDGGRMVDGVLALRLWGEAFRVAGRPR